MGRAPAVVRRPLVRIEEELVIPKGVEDLEVFRRWLRSPSSPTTGRIDFLDGTIEVDMSPEETQTHGQPKGELFVAIDDVATERDLGQVYVDRTRLTSPRGRLSCEPDILFVSWDSLGSGRAKYVSHSRKHPERLIEIDGAADLAVEVASDSSAGKDLRRLRRRYARAGVRELWLADARRSAIDFRILTLERGRYRPVAPDARGSLASSVLGRAFLLRRERGRIAGTWRYHVDTS